MSRKNQKMRAAPRWPSDGQVLPWPAGKTGGNSALQMVMESGSGPSVFTNNEIFWSSYLAGMSPFGIDGRVGHTCLHESLPPEQAGVTVTAGLSPLRFIATVGVVVVHSQGQAFFNNFPFTHS